MITEVTKLVASAQKNNITFNKSVETYNTNLYEYNEFPDKERQAHEASLLMSSSTASIPMLASSSSTNPKLISAYNLLYDPNEIANIIISYRRLYSYNSK